MTILDRDIAVATVLSAVGFLGLLTFVTYRCNPSLFRRRHRPRNLVEALRRHQHRPADAERIDPVKLSKLVSNTTNSSTTASSLRSYADGGGDTSRASSLRGGVGGPAAKPSLATLAPTREEERHGGAAAV